MTWHTLCSAGWCWWLVLIFCERKVLLAGWLVLILCEREIPLAGCSEDEANRVIGSARGLTNWPWGHRARSKARSGLAHSHPESTQTNKDNLIVLDWLVYGSWHCFGFGPGREEETNKASEKVRRTRPRMNQPSFGYEKLAKKDLLHLSFAWNFASPPTGC